MQTINNGVLEVTVSENGGYLDSVKYRGEEYLWQGSELSWKSRDIVIFPFVARLKDGWYTVDGEKYEMRTHGLARYNIFETTHKTDKSVTLTLKSDENTKTQYPFDFVFSVTYTVEGASLNISFKVENKGKREMPFGLGTHAGFIINGDDSGEVADTSGNYVILDTDKPITEIEFDNETHLCAGEKNSAFTNKIELKKSTFANDAVVTVNNAEKVTLLRRDGKKLVYDIGNAPILSIWSNASHGLYACVEIWWGLPDFVNPDRELKNKPYINKLAAGKTFEYGYKISF